MSEAPAAAKLRLSVIVPAWNEGELLPRLVAQLASLERLHEIIIVDVAPDRLTAQTMRAAGATYLHAGAPNRGAQMNLGAENATGDVLIFHHADSVLTRAHLAAIELALQKPSTIGGAFHRKFDERHPWLRPLELVGRALARHGGSFFGDQSIFVRREIFRQLGGFSPIPLMEDLEFSRRLRRAGAVAVLDPPLLSSSRRHHRRGAWRTSIENGILILLYQSGISPETLHRLYYGERFSPALPNDSVLAAQPVEELGRR